MGVIFPKPKAKNDLKNLFMFGERLNYKQNSFTSYDPVPLDMIYEKPFYGKVDKEGRTIYPSEVNMSQIPGAGLLLVHNFVAKAFKDLKSTMELNIYSKHRRFVEIFPSGYTPVAARKNFHKLYQDHFVDNVYNVFINDYVVNTPRRRHIRKFSDFLQQFVNFSELMEDQFPITKTGFIMSPICPHSISGLIIEVEGIAKDDDGKKYDGFISKSSFRDYVRIVSGFGFYVDKNCPWRLAVNLDHPTMTERYMPAFGTSYEDNKVFEDYFYRSEYYSYEDFKARMWYGYRSLLVNNDTDTFGLIHTVRNCSKVLWADVASQSYKTAWKEGFLEEISSDFDTFQLEYPDSFLLPYYFKIRTSESGIQLSSRQYKVKLKKILHMNKIKGLQKAIAIMEEVTKQSNIYLNNEKSKYPRNIKYFGKNISSGLHSYEERDKVTKKADVKQLKSYVVQSADEM